MREAGPGTQQEGDGDWDPAGTGQRLGPSRKGTAAGAAASPEPFRPGSRARRTIATEPPAQGVPGAAPGTCGPGGAAARATHS